MKNLIPILLLLLPALSYGKTLTHGLGSVTDEYICTWEADTSTLECDVNIDDYCPLTGCSMTGSINFLDNQGVNFGTTDQGSIYFDGSDLIFEMDIGVVDFLGGIKASSTYDEYSIFGGDPTSLTPSNTLDRFVSRKLRTTNSASRAAMFVVDVNSDVSISTGQMGLNAGVFTGESNTSDLTKTAGFGGATAGRYFIRHYGSGTLSNVGGVASKCAILGATEDGIITTCYGFMDEGGDGGAGTGYIDNYHGVWIRESIGNVNEKIGLYIESLQNATDNYGVKIDGASDGAFWMNNNTAIDGTFFWGTAKDTNLYRSAADTLMTDDDFVSAGVIKMNTTDQVATKPELVDEKCFYKNNPQTDQEWESIWHAPRAITIVQIWCETDAGTVAMDFEVDDGTPAGVNGSDVSCAAPNGTTDFLLGGDPTMAQGDRLDLDLGTVTTAVRLSACFKYTVD